MRAKNALALGALATILLGPAQGIEAQTKKTTPKQSRPKLEETVKTTNPPHELKVDASTIQDPYTLHRFLLIEQGLAGEKHFVNSYEGFVNGLSANLTFIPFERASLYIPAAARIAAAQYPGKNLVADLVKSTFDRALRNVLLRVSVYSLAEGSIDLGMNVGRAYKVDTKAELNKVIDAVFDKAAKGIDEGAIYDAEHGIKLLASVKNRYGIEYKDLASKLAEKIVVKAIADIEEGSPFHFRARGYLDLLETMGKELGVDGNGLKSSFFEQLLGRASGYAALNKTDNARDIATMGRILAEAYANQFVPRFDAFEKVK